MKSRFTFAVLTLSLALCACTHSVHLVGFSDDVPLQKKKTARLIESHTEQFVILGFSGDTAYVDQAYHKLMHACPDGNVCAIATKFYTDHGFFSWTNHVELEGFCYN